MENNREIIVHDQPKSPVSESFRLFRTNLLYLFNDEKGKVLNITSVAQGDGKSFVTANLGIAFAQFGLKVLIVDADLRKGRQHKIFNKLNKTGLSDYLRGLTSKKKADQNREKDEFMNLVLKTEIDNLFLMPSGPVPYNPSELLGNASLDTFLKVARENFDVILFDTPPVSILADSLVICKKVDYVLLVSAAQKTKKDMLVNVKRSIESVGGKIAGVVLNQISMDKNQELYQSYEKYTDVHYTNSKKDIFKNIKIFSHLTNLKKNEVK